MNLLTTNQPLTMSSLDFLNNFINPARQQSGQSLHKNSAFIRKVEDEIDDLGAVKIIDRFNNDVRTYQLTHDQMLLVGMRESKAVRKIALKKLKELEETAKPTLPNFSDPAQAARAWAEQYEANMIKQQQLEIAAPKVEFHDKVVNDSANFSLRDAAKKIQQRPNKFSAWLRSEGYLCQNNLPK